MSETIKIGPSFGDELMAKDPALINSAWSPDGTYNISSLSEAQQAEFLAVLAAHDPTKSGKQTLIAQLAALDAYIPRGLEDYWAATGFDTTKLPTVQQQRLTQKQTLRQQIQTTG